MADDGYTTILRTTDPTQGELVAEMLRREGIDARFHQVRSTLIGLAGNLIEMAVDVPTEAEARARALLSELEYVGAAEHGADGAEPLTADGGAEAPAGRADGPLRSRRHPLFAAGFAVFLPGGGHLYARRAWTALVMAAGVVACLALLVTSSAKVVSELAIAATIAVVASDAIGGVLAARAEARGERKARRAQLARGLGLLCLALAVGVGGALATSAPRLSRAAQLEKYKVSCTGDAIVIENGGSEPRALDIWHLRVAALSVFGEQTYDIAQRQSVHLSLAPGARGTFSPNVADWLAHSCQFSEPAPSEGSMFGKALRELELPVGRPLDCGFVFSFVAHAPDDKIEGFGHCVPATRTNSSTRGALELAP